MSLSRSVFWGDRQLAFGACLSFGLGSGQEDSSATLAAFCHGHFSGTKPTS